MIIRTSHRLFSSCTRSCNGFKPPSASQKAAAREAITKMLATPTWSVRSMLPSDSSTSMIPTVSSEKLHHILRLAALPPPDTPEEEAKLLKDLHDQLHFVNAIQTVDTEGVRPLTAIRDETIENKGITFEDIKRAEREANELEKVEEKWDVLGNASKKVGRFFVVEGEMGEQENADEVVVTMEEVRKVEDKTELGEKGIIR